MGLCDAHQGMADNIERLMNGQDKLFDLQRETANDIKGMSVTITKLSEGQAQNAAQMEAILAEVKKLKKRPSPVKTAAIFIAALLGGGGISTLITALKAGGKTP